MKKVSTAVVAGTAAITLALTGCSSKASDSGSGGGGGGEGDVKTDVGVTDDTISLGVLTDTSGVFKVLGLGLTAGNQLWADDVNEAGGICGRDIELDVQDTGYKPDNALPQYDAQKANVLGQLQLIGSPILAALKQKVISDNMVVVPSSWASMNLDAEQVMMVGATYDVEIINGLAWMAEQGMIADGDKIGHIYVDSEYGQNGLMGSKAYAEEHGMEVIEAPVAGTDTDMTTTITKMKDAGVTAIAITLAPGGTGSVMVQNTAQGLNVPVLGSNPVYAPTLLEDSQVAEALSNLYIVNSAASYADENVEFAQELATDYEAEYQDEPNIGVNIGYAFGMAWEAVLNQACDDGDLSRAGILAAKEKVTDVDTKGLYGALDFSVPGAPSSRETVVQQADASIPGTLKTIQPATASDEAKAYKAPFEK